MRGLPVVLVAGALFSCHVVFPFGPVDVDQGPMDTATAAKGDLATAHESGNPDIAQEGGTPSPDAELLDAPPADQTVLPPDTGADAPSVDTGPVSPNPCAAGIKKGTKWSPGPMQTCLAAGPIDQCKAEALCNVAGGWHLCTASEYLARGGATSGSVEKSWLKSCVRSNGDTPTSPTDNLCAACNVFGSASNLAEVGWYCSTGVVQYNVPHDNVGVRTNIACKRVGQNSPGTEAFWAPLTSGSSGVAVAAVCCAP